MRYKELIKEVPISDIQPMGDPDPEIDQDYSDPDEGMPACLLYTSDAADE